MNAGTHDIPAVDAKALETLLTGMERTVREVLVAIEPLSRISKGLDAGYLENLFKYAAEMLASHLDVRLHSLEAVALAGVQQLTSYAVLLVHNARVADGSEGNTKSNCERTCEQQYLWCIDHTPNALCRLELIACRNACAAPSNAGAAWLYEHHYFQGQCLIREPGEYPDLGAFNFDKKLTSLRTNGLTVQLFSGKDFTGQSETFNGDSYNVDVQGHIGNDYASSCKIYRG